MSTYLFMLVVRSEDPSLLVELADVAHRDVADALLAAKLLHDDGEVELVSATHVVFRASHTATVQAGRAGHEQLQLEATVEDASGLVEGRLSLDDRRTADGDDSLERSFVVARDAGQTAQILSADTLLVAIAETAPASGLPSLYDIPPIPDSSRARRQRLDEILLDRP